MRCVVWGECCKDLGTTAQGDSTERQHRATAQSDSTGRQHRTTAQDDSTGRQHRATAQGDSTGRQHRRQHRTTAQRDSTGQQRRAKAQGDSTGRQHRATAQEDIRGRQHRAIAQEDSTGRQHRATAQDDSTGRHCVWLDEWMTKQPAAGSIIIVEKLTFPHLLKKFPALCKTHVITTFYTATLNWSSSWIKWTQSQISHILLRKINFDINIPSSTWSTKFSLPFCFFSCNFHFHLCYMFPTSLLLWVYTFYNIPWRIQITN
jgi:hypothetical protein